MTGRTIPAHSRRPVPG